MSDSEQKQSQWPSSIFVICTWIRKAEEKFVQIVISEISILSIGINFFGQLKVFELLFGSSQNEKCSHFVSQLEIDVVQLLQLYCGKFVGDGFVFVRLFDDRLAWAWVGEPIVVIECFQILRNEHTLQFITTR